MARSRRARTQSSSSRRSDATADEAIEDAGPSSDALGDSVGTETGDLMPSDLADPETQPVSRKDSHRRSSARVRASGASGKRSARRSQRSGRKSARRSDRRSPEEIAARRAAIRNGILTVLIVLAVGGGGVGAYLALREEPIEVTVELDGEQQTFSDTPARLAARFLSMARAFRDAADQAISARHPDVARSEIDKMLVMLKTPQLGGGREVSPDDPDIGSVGQVRRAQELLADAESLRQRLRRVEEDVAAQTHYDRLQAQINAVKEVEDLDALTEAVTAFVGNPVDPEAGVDPDLQERYRTMVDEMSSKLKTIARERLVRLMQNTTQVVEVVNIETQKQINQDRFAVAFDLIDEAERKYPSADLERVRAKVRAAAAESWAAARASAENLYQDAVAPGAGEEIREVKLRDAIAVLERVVDRYGTEEHPEVARYILDAQRLLRRYRDKL